MREKEYLTEFKDALETAKKEVAEMPKYKLIEALQNGDVKLNKEIANRYDKDIPDAWLDENGIDPNDVAQDFGFTNADILLNELVNAPSVNELASQMAGEQMLDRHEELFDELSIQDSAAKAIYNEQTIENLVQEEIHI